MSGLAPLCHPVSSFVLPDAPVLTSVEKVAAALVVSIKDLFADVVAASKALRYNGPKGGR